MFVAGWRHALRSEWPFIIIIISVVFDCSFKLEQHQSHVSVRSCFYIINVVYY